MRLYDPLPLEKLSPQVRQAVLAEFGGRWPSVREVAGIPDAHWLELPGIGPKSLARMRSLTRGARRTARIYSLTGMTVSELQAEYDRLSDQKKAIDDQLKAVRAEFLLRLWAQHPSPKRSRQPSSSRTERSAVPGHVGAAPTGDGSASTR
jgi:hypothetical protein